MNIFTQATKTTTNTKAKKNDKLIVNVTGDEFDANLKAFAEKKEEFDKVKTELSLVQGFVKDVAQDEFYKVYKNTGANPGSFIISSDSDASFLFAPTDRYISIDQERATQLRTEYGDDIVTEDVKFSFNSALLAKYSDVLSALISECDDISDDDKARLIVADQTFSVAKGSIDKALTVGKGDVKTYCDDIQPVYQMKSPKL